jgi:hypothetical protein
MEEQKAERLVEVMPPNERPPVMARFVVVAFVLVALVKTPVLGVVAPIGVLLIVPPSMVRLFATCASVAEPMREVKLMPRLEVASCCHEPPVYEPRRMPPAVGFAIPVPPPPAVRRPLMEFVKVRVLPLPVMVVLAVRPLKAEEEVARVSAPVKEPCGSTSEETPLLIEEVETQVGMPPETERT